LATVYLELQRSLWPALADTFLPAATDGQLRKMSEDLARRHMSGSLDGTPSYKGPLARKGVQLVGTPVLPAPFRLLCDAATGRAGASGLAAAYLRYSCNNSNPRSLDDQLRNVLKEARDMNLFIPWSLVFADASISGTDPSRQGYRSLKIVIEVLTGVNTILIDEFSRGGRDVPEWFRLAHWAKNHAKNVVGATDSFDLKSPMGNMMLHVFGMFSEYFLVQLREKVLRGSIGAAKRGTSTGRPGLGYGLVPVLDNKGRPVLGADGTPTRRKAIHQPTMQYVELARRILLDEHASVGEVVREFNSLKVDGSNGWTDCSIRRTLSNPIYFGIEIYNRTRNEWDSENCKRRTIENVRKDWQRRDAPELRVWDRRTYRAMRRALRGAGGGRRRRSRFAANARVSRNERRPRRLLAGIMKCECGQELKQVRGGPNASYACYHGYFGTHGCTMTTAKAARVLEEAILDHVRQNFLTPEAVRQLLDRAKILAEKEAARPPVDIRPLQSQADELKSRRQRLIDLVGSGQSKSFEFIRPQIEELSEQIEQIEETIRRARRRPINAVRPLALADVEGAISDLSSLLAGAPEEAALALRDITGVITVKDQPYSADGRYGGTKGGKWVLSFTPRIGSALTRQLEAKSASADLRQQVAETSEAEEAIPVTLVADRRQSVHARLAPQVKSFIGKVNPGTGKPFTRKEVASQLGQKIDVIHLAWRLAEMGFARRPRTRPSRAKNAAPQGFGGKPRRNATPPAFR
jgi:DNA invertase Pin-like site-specific DNA recombinase